MHTPTHRLAGVSCQGGEFFPLLGRSHEPSGEFCLRGGSYLKRRLSSNPCGFWIRSDELRRLCHSRMGADHTCSTSSLRAAHTNSRTCNALFGAARTHLKLELQGHSSDLKDASPFEVQCDILGCSLWLEARKEALEVETEKCEMGSPRGFLQQGPVGRTTTTTTLIEEGPNILSSTVGESGSRPLFWRPHHARPTEPPRARNERLTESALSSACTA